MRKFPVKEADIYQLAGTVCLGLKNHPAVFPVPPVPWARLNLKRMLYQQRCRYATHYQAALAAAQTSKEQALAALVRALKKNLRYAEHTVGGDDVKLRLLGWSGPRGGRPLTAPGQVRRLEIAAAGPQGVRLRWQPPKNGGLAAAYRVQQCGSAAPRWRDVAGTTGTAVLVRPAAGEEHKAGGTAEYRVLAVNRAGTGPASNVVTLAVMRVS